MKGFMQQNLMENIAYLIIAVDLQWVAKDELCFRHRTDNISAQRKFPILWEN